MKLSILVPIYNEESWIPRWVEEMRRAPIERCVGVDAVELVVVDDGSSDGTATALEKYLGTSLKLVGGMNASVRRIRHEKNAGKGAAVRTALGASTGDIVIVQDADLEYSPADYPTMLAPIVSGQADAVFGSRFVGHPRRVLYYWHTVMNQFLTWFCNALSNLNLTDMECGYKAIAGNIARDLRLVSRRFGIEPELTMRLAHARVRLYEVPVSYAGRTYDQGKKIGAKDGIAALFHIFKFGLLDREPFKPGLRQTLSALDLHAKVIYQPALHRAFVAAGIPREASSGSILEIGAGIGTLSIPLTKYGRVLATDVSPEFLGEVEKRDPCKNIETMTWDATKAFPEKSRRFGAVVAFNVLEHLREDVSALRTWAELLEPQGKLIVLVPHYASLYSKLDEAVGHHRRYNRRSLESAMAQAGLRVIAWQYANPLALPGWLLSAKLLGRTTLSSRSLGLYTLLARLLGPVELVARQFTGLSVVAIAERADHQRSSRNERLARAA